MKALATVMNPSVARRITDQIKAGVEAMWELIKEAYTERAWEALGYGSWDDYCTREFGTSRLRLPREERREVVASLRDSGLSLRAIEAATGSSRKTVIKDINQVVESTPPNPDEDASAEKLIGVDGKRYPSTAARPTNTDRSGATARPGRTPLSKRIQKISADTAERCRTLTDEQVAEALGAAQYLYELLRGEKIIRERSRP